MLKQTLLAMIVTVVAITTPLSVSSAPERENLELIARVVQAEAINEPMFAKICVAATIRNRARMTGQSATSIAISRAYHGSMNLKAMEYPLEWGNEIQYYESVTAVEIIFASENDRLENLTHFHDWWSTPAWTAGIRPCLIVGGLYFYDSVWFIPQTQPKRPGRAIE